MELEKHRRVVGTPGSSVGAGAPFEVRGHHFCTACNQYGRSACNRLWGVVTGTAMAADLQAPDTPVEQQGCKLQVYSGDCKAVCWLRSLEHNLKKSKDWILLPQGTVLQHTDAAAVESVSGTAVFVAAVVVQWLPAAPPATAVDKPGTQPSVAA